MQVKSKNETELGFENHLPTSSRVNLFNLRGLLYLNGCSQTPSKVVEIVESGILGRVRNSRLQLVSLIHTYFCNKLSNGYSELSINKEIYGLRDFYSFGDGKGVDFTLSNISEQYTEWTKDKLLKIENKLIIGMTGYSYTRTLSVTLSGALELPSGALKSAIDYRHLKKPGFPGVESDKSDPNEGFQYGALLLDIIGSLSYESCCGKLPVMISFADGKFIELEAHAPRRKAPVGEPYIDRNLKRAEAQRKKKISGDVNTRAMLINLRIDAEFNLFVAQTGLNVSTAFSLPMADFRYASIDDCYDVRAYKSRRGGDVEFRIYKEYRPYFDRYLKFLHQVFPSGVTKLFPFLNRSKKESQKKTYSQARLKKFFKSVGRKTIALSRLRNKQVNWLLRNSDDHALVANVAQHSIETLHRKYTKPNLHIASAEMGKFFRQAKIERQAVLYGACESTGPKKIPTVEVGPEPDCINPAGCAFCEHYRGNISFDYIWTIKTYIKLKRFELARLPLIQDVGNSPQQALINQLVGIADSFSQQNLQCSQWVVEADLRMAEGDHHPAFRALLEIMM